MMNDEQQRIARGRLRIGILGVGLWVGLATLGLVGLKWGDPTELSGSVVLAGLLGLTLMQGIPDLVGGMFLMPQPRPRFRVWLGRWIRGVLIQGGILVGMGVLGLISFRLVGGFCGSVAVGSMILAWIRPMLVAVLAGGRSGWETVGGRKVRVVEVEDP